MKTLTWSMLIGCTMLLFAAQRTDAIKCYICVNIVNRAVGCNDPFDENNKDIGTLESCASCEKSEVSGVMKRTCLQTSHPDECNENGDNTTCTCLEDLCNFGTRVSAPVTFLTVLVGVIVVPIVLRHH